jgi:hypothetical protein
MNKGGKIAIFKYYKHAGDLEESSSGSFYFIKIEELK